MKWKVVITGLLLIFLMGGCSKQLTEYQENTLTINKDGTILDISVEDFSEGNYDMSNLEQFIRDEVTDYNAKNGDDRVVLNELNTDNKLARLELLYQSMDDYNAFNHTEYTLKDLIDTTLSGTMISAQDGSEIPASDVEDKDYLVLEVTDAMNLEFQGKVLYYNEYITAQDGTYLSSGEGTAVVVFK